MVRNRDFLSVYDGIYPTCCSTGYSPQNRQGRLPNLPFFLMWEIMREKEKKVFP